MIQNYLHYIYIKDPGQKKKKATRPTVISSSAVERLHHQWSNLAHTKKSPEWLLYQQNEARKGIGSTNLNF